MTFTSKLADDFLSMYHQVFDEVGNVKPCGRDMTKSLIRIAQQLQPDVDFGDLRTGYMNVEHMHNLIGLIEEV